jgi:Zn-finger nucleic acid-binding protein
MKCPTCTTNIDLTMTERQGVEIDYCPKCRGVWLDRGELDKIVELSTPQSQVRRNDREDRRREEFDDDRDDYRRSGRRRESFLGDLFDF